MNTQNENQKSTKETMESYIDTRNNMICIMEEVVAIKKKVLNLPDELQVCFIDDFDNMNGDLCNITTLLGNLLGHCTAMDMWNEVYKKN